MAKIGRNDPCPCGSGKKLKKCCGAKDKEFDFSLPEDCITGTPFDDYMMLFQGIAFYGQSLMQFDKEGKEIKKASKDFEKRFKPGTEQGAADSLHMGWLYLDFRFGKTGETIAERFLKSEFMDKIIEPGPAYIKHMADSYCAFYQVKNILDDWIVFEELGTGIECRVHRIDDEYERISKKGDIWYVRFVGIPAEGYPFATPFIIPSKAKQLILKEIQSRVDVFAENTKQNISEGDFFKEFCKASIYYWIESLLHLLAHSR